MAPIFELSTSIDTNSIVFGPQPPETPYGKENLPIDEDTPVDKFAMSTPTVVRPGPFFNAQHYPIPPPTKESANMEFSSSSTSTDAGLQEPDVSADSEDSFFTTGFLSPNELASIQKEWMGTSQLLDAVAIELQLKGQLPELIVKLKRDLKGLGTRPYDPTVYISIAIDLNRLGFSDAATGYAMRALILIRTGLGIDQIKTLPDLKDSVIQAMKDLLRLTSETILQDELKAFLLDAYITLLDAMMGSCCYWDGLLAAKEALQYFPHDPDILDLREQLKHTFKEHCAFLSEKGLKESDLTFFSRSGKIFVRQYPWLAKKLSYRTPQLIKDLNKTMRSNSCEIRPVFNPEVNSGSKKVKDVGTCGIYATRDIKAGERILIDPTVLGVSDIPTSTLDFCDTCHGALKPPYMVNPDDFVPRCCNKVAYCSTECAKIAVEGHHKVLCGKNTDEVYVKQGVQGQKLGWRPIMFQRLVAIILNDKLKGKYQGHPLQHPSLASLTGNYTPAPVDKVRSKLAADYTYQENVVVPVWVLLEIGIDIFANSDWAPEVIQTIYNRLDNNANQAIVDDILESKKVSILNINPHYIFFNHSCLPNIIWHSALCVREFGDENIMGPNGEVHRPCESTMFCHALRDIKKDEQLFITYVGDPLGLCSDEEKREKTGDVDFMSRKDKRGLLKKWFDDGCGCEVCEKENAERKELEHKCADEIKTWERIKGAVGGVGADLEI